MSGASERGDGGLPPAFSTAANVAAEARDRFWRALDEVREVPFAAGGAPPTLPLTHASSNAAPLHPPRREFMKWMGATLALAGSAGCSRAPLEPIVPFRQGVDGAASGDPVFYATAVERDGYGMGVLVETKMGRPTKVEGNPLHAASLGATDIFAQAAVLELWDPDRSATVKRERQVDSWQRFVDELRARLRAAADGAGVFVLTPMVSSPSLHDQLRTMLRKYPRARWHQWQPLNRDAVYDGSRIAFGKALEPRYRFGSARVIAAFDADFLDAMPGGVRHARDLADARRILQASTGRLYVAEGTPSLTGARADHKRNVRSSEVAALVQALALRVGAGNGGGINAGASNNRALDNDTPNNGSANNGTVNKGTISNGTISNGGSNPPASSAADAWLDALAADLLAHRGASIVVAGDRQPAAVHAAVHAINDALGNHGRTIELGAPVAFEGASQEQSLRELVAAMRAEAVQTLLILDGNPVYQAPADLEFEKALTQVPWTAHLSLFDDETSFRCRWHLPATHVFERWGDVRAFDGTVTLQQPCIAPLYDGHSAHDLLSVITDETPRGGWDVVRTFWQRQRTGDFDAFWRDALWRGTMDAPTLAPTPALQKANFSLALSAPSAGIELVFAADPTLADGRHANNAWLQELPKPLTTLTWDNAALVAPALAARLQLDSGDVVEVVRGARKLQIPVWVMPGHADQMVTLHLGHGRSRAGSVGNGVGVDAYRLRESSALWTAGDVTVRRTGARAGLAVTQTHSRMEGRDLVRSITRDAAAQCSATPCAPAHAGEPKVSLYPDFPYDDYKWGMSIDLNSCIGCGACTIACQAENNIPVVGKEEVMRGREMHWIRVDRYYEGSPERPRTLFQPVPCMQCERAPCEEVCPVEASVHDAEGLNVQVYNRCVGTRFCSNNCPYKVRRFNFLSYTRQTPSLDAQRNPEVTVRMRGVMEKCSYCIQRIANGRVNADRENRRIADGEVVTACQAVCPTRSIVFGDLNDPASEVNQRKRSPFDYALLAELNTRPRTTYLPKVTDPAAGLEPS